MLPLRDRSCRAQERFAKAGRTFYPKAGGGRKPYPLETMLCIHLLQNWFSLSDPVMEEALYETVPTCQFAGLTLIAPIPEDTTIMIFRHLLEKHKLAPAILAVINGYLQVCRCARAPLYMRPLFFPPFRQRKRKARSRDASNQEK